MSTILKHRRGTTAQHASFTGAVGEITVDTDKDTAVVHDGTTVGGFPLLAKTMTDGTANGVAYLNGSKVLTTGSALQFDGSNLGLGVTPSAWAIGKVLQISAATGSFLYGAGGQTILGTNAYYDTSWKYGGTGNATYYQQANGAHTWFTAPSGTAGAAISFSSAMTLTAAGDLLVGTTSAAGAKFQVNAASEVVWEQFTGSSGTHRFANASALTVGSITWTASATAYNTSSDYRLKNITGPITTSGAYIDSLNPVEGTWKADGSTFVGLIAHEVQEASRTTVATGVKDGEEMQGMDYSSAEIIANLIAEVKSLRQRLAAAGI